MRIEVPTENKFFIVKSNFNAGPTDFKEGDIVLYSARDRDSRLFKIQDGAFVASVPVCGYHFDELKEIETEEEKAILFIALEAMKKILQAAFDFTLEPDKKYEEAVKAIRKGTVKEAAVILKNLINTSQK